MTTIDYFAPTEIHLGAEAQKRTAEMLRKYGAAKVLIHYGSERVRKNGLLDEIEAQLNREEIPFVTLGGVVPNPRLSLIREGIDLCRREGVDFILAVGGGSVIDSAKAIAYGVPLQGDVWDIYMRRVVPTESLPVGVVLTIPAAGSEMSNSSVITCETPEGDLKRGYNNDICRPKFALMNPVFTFTLPPFQTACGVIDIMMHNMERYFTRKDAMPLTDGIAETVMRTALTCGLKVLGEPDDYDARASIMWAASLSHNDLTGERTTGDWACHGLEHELSALFDVAHGAGLAVIFPAWAHFAIPHAPARFARFAYEVMGVGRHLNSDEAARMGIEMYKALARKMGMPVSIPELIGRKATEDEIHAMAKGAVLLGPIGRVITIDAEKAAEIYRLANQ